MTTTIDKPAYIIIDPTHWDWNKRMQSIISQQGNIIEHQHEAVALCEELIDPDGFGHAVTQEVRNKAYRALQTVGLRPQNKINKALAKPTKVYLAGPMTGLPEYNYPAFFQAAELLRERGLLVQNPAEHAQRNPQSSWVEYMRQALKIMLDCDELYLLPGWGKSNGVYIEHRLALDLNMPISYPEDWMGDK